MALRTADQYRSGLEDDREVYVDGALANVLAHPGFSIPLEAAGNVYELALTPATRELFTFSDGARIVNRYFQPLDGVDALLTRARLLEEHARLGRSTLNVTKAIGTDALAALVLASYELRQAGSDQYSERVGRFGDYCADADLSLAVAQTDAKGNRSLRPHEQPDKDAYVRMVARRRDGILVRGAKAHTTMAPLVDELIVIPSRSLTAQDSDYAVSFAIPVATPGVKMICGPLPRPPVSVVEQPVSGRNVEVATLTIFEDVFVPWERVFLAGEWQLAGSLALAFATFHRFTSISYKLPFADLLLGCALEIADLNGITRAPHVREKLARLIHYRQLLRACVEASARHAVPHDCGLMLPAPAYVAAGKFHFANGYHVAVKFLQDLAGGSASTLPGEGSLRGAETEPWMRKYLAGAGDPNSERRVRLLYLIRDLTASDFGGHNFVINIHGEGSLQAQLMQMLREADLGSARQMVDLALS
jgi:4-hydroxybutyryl-CoA dehydratase/vinylacetyl-CoA-Delta-isomerase